MFRAINLKPKLAIRLLNRRIRIMNTLETNLNETSLKILTSPSVSSSVASPLTTTTTTGTSSSVSKLNIHATVNPNDINSVKSYALLHCIEYLGGIWKTIRLNQFKIEKLSGGLSNYLYLCSIPNEIDALQNEPKQVVLRIYGENHHNNSSILLKDVVICALMSDKGFGPKLYGIFPQGRLEEFLKSTQLIHKDFANADISHSIASILARLHTLEMPFMKEPKWLFDTTTRYLKQIESISFKTKEEQQKFNKLLSYDLNNEFNDLKALLETINSPVVFCHNDLQPGNILKIEDGGLVVIDYEYSSYNYRGFDLGNHFCEYMFNNNHDKYPYFTHNEQLYPSRQTQLKFIRAYLNECRLTRRKLSLPIDCEHEYFNEEHLLREANYFSLASHFFWSIWAICQAAVTQIEFSFLDYALVRMDLYYKKKKNLLKQEEEEVNDRETK